jgi:RNA recognition motif-containing protein
VIVKGLSFKAEGEDVREFFSQYGEISSVNIERRYNGDSKGSCFIKFATAEGLNNSIAASGVEFLGRQVWIAKTKPKSERVKEYGPRRGYNRGGYGGYNRYQGGYNDGGYGGGYNNYGGGYGGRGGRGGRGGYNNRRGGGGYYNKRGRGGRGGRRPQRVEKSKIVFVGNLNYRSEKDEIWDFFDAVGKVVDIRIAKNPSGSVSFNFYNFI